MSWDIALMRPIPKTIPLEQVTSDMYVMGTREDVIAELRRICRTVTFPNVNNPNTGLLEGELGIQGEDYSIEFDFLEAENGFIDSIWTNNHRWFGDDAIDILHQICQTTGWRVFDVLSGIFINIQTGDVETDWHGPEDLSAASSEDIDPEAY